jgi:GxxExxY protein
MTQPDIRDPQTYAIIGAAMEVHSMLGHGFLESVYQDALEVEFRRRSIPHQREAGIEIEYKGERLKSHYRADFICYDEVIIELKALSQLTTHEEAQVLNYLKATGLQRALLINFGERQLKYKRLVWEYQTY